MTGNLNQNVGFWQIERGIGDFRDENCVDFRIGFEILDDCDSLGLRSGTVNERLFQNCGVMLQTKDIV